MTKTVDFLCDPKIIAAFKKAGVTSTQVKETLVEVEVRNFDTSKDAPNPYLDIKAIKCGEGALYIFGSDIPMFCGCFKFDELEQLKIQLLFQLIFALTAVKIYAEFELQVQTIQNEKLKLLIASNSNTDSD